MLALEYTNTRKATRDHVRGKYRINYENMTRNETFRVENMKPNAFFINESVIDQLIMKSKICIAERFQDWVCDEVLL